METWRKREGSLKFGGKGSSVGEGGGGAASEAHTDHKEIS